MKLIPLTFKSWDDIRYYNEFTKACRVQDTQAKFAVPFVEENRTFETFIILN